MVNAYLIVATLFLSVLSIGLVFAYQSGALDPLIQKIGMYYFKGKAIAEVKGLQVQGMKEGEDFMASDLKGNQQANEIAEGFGGVGGGIGDLKKGL